MELWQEVIVNKWRRLDDGEVMGYEVARKARELADYDTYGTRNFSSYVESAIRGYQANEQAYDDMHITTTHDLHDVQCNSYALHDFDYYMSERWRDYFMYALENGI